MFFRVSEIDGDTLVLEIQDGDTGTVVDLLDARGHGYAMYGEDVALPVAVVDGRLRTEKWCTADHLLAIEAHEIGHISMNSIDESVAEWAGIHLLESKGYNEAAQLLRERGVAK